MQDEVKYSALVKLRIALDAAIRNAATWTSEHPLQMRKLQGLRRDPDLISVRLGTRHADQLRPGDALWRWSANALSCEGQEALLSLMHEPHGILAEHYG